MNKEILDQLNELEIKIEDLFKRIHSAIETIDEEQERMDIFATSLNNKIHINYDFVFYNIVSSKMSLELIKSMLKNSVANYSFKNISKRVEIEEGEHDKAFKNQIKKVVV